MSKQTVVVSADSLRGKQGLLKIACAVLLVGMCIFPGAAKAQVLYGVLTGNVTDPSSAAVPDAQVEALNMATGVSRRATTDSGGIYRFTELLPGTYKVTVSAPNFGTSVTENVSIEANNTRRVDVQLQLKAQTESVTVSAAPPVLQTDTADVHTDISGREIEDLPILASNGRNFQNAYRIIPGVGLLGENNSAAGNPQRAQTANVNGLSINNNNTRIDGASDTYTWLPANVAYIPSADAIESVNVVTNNFDAEQGLAGGLVSNVTIKSGTNQFHGTAYEYHTDNHLRTRNYFRPAVVQPVIPKNIFNQYGGTFGGPIKKDKLFFFGAYEGTKIRTAGGAAKNVPPNSIRNGDFSALLPAVGSIIPGSTGVAFVDCNTTPAAGCIYDPNSVNANANGTARTAFPGNKIPANRIDPAAAKMASLIPAPNVGDPNNPTNITNNFIPVGAPQYNLSRIDAKVNYVPSTKSMVFARYSISPSFIFDPPALGPAGGDATGGGQNGNAFSRVQSVALGGSYQISPNMLWDVNAGYTRLRLNAENVDIGTNFGLDTLHIPGTNGTDHAYGGIPAFQFAAMSFANLGNANTGNPFIFRDNQYVANTNLSWIKGRHDLRFGLEYYRSGINHFQPQGGTFGTPRGTFGFDGSVTSLNGAPGYAAGTNNPYNSFAQFLLGLPQRDGKVFQNINPNALRFTTWAWYARDRWQITPKLTFTYGVRWEYYPFATSDHTGAKFFDPTTGNVLIGGIGSVPGDDGVDVGHGMFAPRFGIAYRLQSKTVIRAGYGISVDPNNFRALRDTFPNITNMDYQGNKIFGSNFAPSASLTGTNAIAPYSGLVAGITLVPFTGLGNGVIRLPNNVGTATVANPFHRGYAQSYNLIAQHEFYGWVAEAGYVGTRGIRIPLGLNINAGPPTTAANSNLLRLLNANPAVCPVVVPAVACWGDINAVTPFKVTYYDSLQTKLSRRLGGGTEVGFAYTFSKAIDYGENEGSVFHPFPANWGDDKALAGFDRMHNFQAYGVYELPFGKTKRWARHGIANILAGGWQLNWILSRYSGVPLTVTGGTDDTHAAGATLTPDLIGPITIFGNVRHQDASGNFVNCAVSDTTCQYFSATSFGPVTGTPRYGTAGRNILRGPGFFDLDTGLLRNFRITERVSFQFRVNAFAVTNTPNFGNPNLSLGTLNFGVITSTASGPQFSSEAGNLTGQRTFWFAGRVTF
jgi:hypothetical protein